jgi:hypothetical protein
MCGKYTFNWSRRDWSLLQNIRIMFALEGEVQISHIYREANKCMQMFWLIWCVMGSSPLVLQENKVHL